MNIDITVQHLEAVLHNAAVKELSEVKLGKQARNAWEKKKEAMLALGTWWERNFPDLDGVRVGQLKAEV